MTEEQSEEDFYNSFPELSQTIEYSKNRRFSRTSRIVAEGLYKTIFLGYDHDNGREVAWGTIKVHTLASKERDNILEDLRTFSRLEHPSILKLIDCWEDIENLKIITITELTTCSLKQYIHKRIKNARLKVIKNWCRSILEGIKFLHSRQILHQNIKCGNLFIGRSDGNLRIGIIGNSLGKKNNKFTTDIKSFAYCVIEMCTLTDLDYSKINSKTMPREFMMIDNERIKDFIGYCFVEENIDKLLSHSFLKNEDIADVSPIKVIPNEEIYDISIEEIPRSKHFYVLITRNFEILGKYEFNPSENVAEQFAETIANKLHLPSSYFQEILNTIEQHMLIINHKLTDHFSSNRTHDQLINEFKPQRKQKLSLNIGIQDISTTKKLKVDVLYDLETDTPSLIAEEIILHFHLDHGEFSNISKLISDKIYNSESETYSNYSSQDLLDFSEDPHPSRPGLNSTADFSVPDENLSRRSSIEPQGTYDLNKSRSLSPMGEDENYIVCERARKNDPRDVKQLQEALENILGYKVQSDGVYCKNTEEQVKMFQEQSGIFPNGVVTNKLWSLIMNKSQPKFTNLL